MLIVGGVAGYFGKRLVEKSARVEHIERTSKLLDLHDKMQERGLSVADLNSFERTLSEKRPRLRAIEDAVQIAVDPHTPERLENALALDYSIEGPTQLEMNEAAYSSLVGASLVLQNVLKELERELTESQLQRVKTSQEAWTAYAKEQTALASAPFERGSIQPLVRASEMERLTVQRIAELKDFLSTLRQ